MSQDNRPGSTERGHFSLPGPVSRAGHNSRKLEALIGIGRSPMPPHMHGTKDAMKEQIGARSHRIGVVRTPRGPPHEDTIARPFKGSGSTQEAAERTWGERRAWDSALDCRPEGSILRAEDHPRSTPPAAG